ncbi:sulfotransferase family protein [Mycobacterium sp. 852014-52144_SCH5372336]|uniref:sulfotransferase family protein n=1 Tax=Mycobacterium sp. 852014-52144_SCH5372336 TaxID=1834115 RepID=UPI0018D2AC72|nr:sulfotransferase family protein [Mycobacterium sp. 852014-52144_SCH5372336]
MPRSGTSAITRVLSLCGCELPTGMMGAMPENPLGHWEPRAALHLNDKILRRNGSGWYDPTLRLQEDGVLDAEERAACVGDIREFLSTLPSAPLIVLKDPKITVLVDIWFEAARTAGFEAVSVIALRPPEEVVASITAPGGVSSELAKTLWLKYTLLAERKTRGLPRVFLEYANLLDDWRREVARVSEALEIDLSEQDEAEIGNFLRPSLHRQRHIGPVEEPFGTDWFSVVYETLRGAARDEPLQLDELDRVYEEYRTSECGFRKSFEDFDRLQKLNRFMRPSLTKLMYEIRALANRRSGSWA